MMILLSLFLLAYLVGAIPFGYLVGRARGVNLFNVGSGNIGATNAGRALGRPYGIAVFVLDFLKGAVPVAFIEPMAKLWSPEGVDALRPLELLSVGAAAFAFLGRVYE